MNIYDADDLAHMTFQNDSYAEICDSFTVLSNPKQASVSNEANSNEDSSYEKRVINQAFEFELDSLVEKNFAEDGVGKQELIKIFEKDQHSFRSMSNSNPYNQNSLHQVMIPHNTKMSKQIGRKDSQVRFASFVEKIDHDVQEKRNDESEFDINEVDKFVDELFDFK